MATVSSTKGGQSEHREDVKMSWEEGAVQEKEIRDAEAMRETAPGIPFKEVIEAHAEEDSQRVKKLKRKIDFRLITILALIYIWAYIDRSNLGNVCPHPSISA